MGCWNKTCGLSNLHIKHGDEAYVFLLEPNEAGDSHCYATHLYKPLLVPFVTEYNDYGGGENSSGVAFPMIMEAVKKNLHEMELGDNEYHDIAVKKDNFDEALFFEAVHEGRLFRKGHYSDPVELQYVMFRKDIVDDILENRVIEKYVGDSKGTGGWENNYIYYRFADIVADILPMIQEMIEKLADMDEDTRLFKLLGGFEYFFDYNHPNKAANWLRGDGYRYCRVLDIKMAVFELLQEGTTEAVLKLEEFLTDYLKGVFIDFFMEQTRKSWIPAGHEGSQGDAASPYRLMCAATIRALDREKAYWIEQNGDEYTEE